MHLQTNATGYRQLTDTFLKSSDISDTSKELYGRISSLYFNYLQSNGIRLDQVTLIDLIAYKQHLLKAVNLKASTVGTYLAVIKKLYKWADAHRLYPDIGKGLKLPKTEDDLKRLPLTNEQATALIEYNSNHLRNYALVTLLLRTGIRTIEAVRSDVGDIKDFCGRKVLYIQGKGQDDKGRFVILTDKQQQAITQYLQTREGLTPTSPLFVAESNRAKDQRLTTRTVRSIVKTGMVAIGLIDSKYSAHSLRHTAGTRFVEKTGDIKKAQMMLGHKKDTTTMKYLKTIETELRLQDSAEDVIDTLY